MVELRVRQGSVTEIDTPLLVVNLFEGVTQPGGATGAVDAALGGQISQLIAEGEITGEPASVSVIHNAGNHALAARRVAVVGLGKRDDFDLEAVRVAAAVAARKARDLKVDSFATIVHGAGVGGLDAEDAARSTMESSILALYRFDQFKESTKPRHTVSTVTVVEQDPQRFSVFEREGELARLTCEAVNKVRDLSVGPSNVVTPAYLAERAREVAHEYGLEITVWGKDELRAAWHERHPGGQSRQQPATRVCRPSLRRARGTQDARGRRQGDHLRHRRHLDQARGPHGVHAPRHDRRGNGDRLDQLAAAARLPVNVLGVFAATENLPSGTPTNQATLPRLQRQDDGDRQHRRRGSRHPV